MPIVPGDHRRTPFERRTDAADLVLIESGGSASLDAFNRAISLDSNIQNCASSRLDSGRFRTCDSVLRCVTCSLYRLAERRSDLLGGMREAPDAVLVSLTRSHGFAPLREEWDGTEKILRKMTDRSDWSRFKKRHGIDGYAIVVEESRTEGWNVHAHAILTFARKLDSGAAERFRSEVRRRWCWSASAVGYEAVEARQAVRMLRTMDDRRDAAVYLTKQNLLHTAPESRQGRYPADLLAGAHAGDADDLDLYIEYLEAAFNRAMIRSYGRLSRASSGDGEGRFTKQSMSIQDHFSNRV